MTSKLFLVGLIIIVKFLYGTPPVFNAPIVGTCIQRPRRGGGVPVQLLQSCLVLEKVEWLRYRPTICWKKVWWYVKVTLQRRLTYSFFFSFNKKFAHSRLYKVLTPYFYLKGLEIWSFILSLGNSELRDVLWRILWNKRKKTAVYTQVNGEWHI